MVFGSSVVQTDRSQPLGMVRKQSKDETPARPQAHGDNFWENSIARSMRKSHLCKFDLSAHKAVFR